MKVTTDYTGIGGGNQLPDMLVIHAMGEFIKIEKDLVLKNKDGSVKKVIKAGVYPAHEWLQLIGRSCHFLQHPDGSFTKQRSTKKICWHARGFNSHSVGIEVLVEGVHTYYSFLKRIEEDWVTEDQYRELIPMSQGIIDFFKMDKVVGHNEISPGRKFDPGGGFKMEWFRNQLSI